MTIDDLFFLRFLAKQRGDATIPRHAPGRKTQFNVESSGDEQSTSQHGERRLFAAIVREVLACFADCLVELPLA